MADECTCQLNGSYDDDEDTSSMESDFQAVNVTNDVGHRLSAQESAMKAFETLGLKGKGEANGEEMDSGSY